MMRIITGSAGGTKLVTPEGLNTRPTSERAKQGVFNILQFEIEGRRVLDLFAGSGQMGLEALSRGGTDAVFVDSDPQALRCIRTNIEKTHVASRATVLEGDFHTALRSMSGQRPFDLIFLDPPYQSRHLTAALTLLLKYKLVAGGAYLVCETGGEIPEFPASLALVKSARYGSNHMTILKYREEEE